MNLTQKETSITLRIAKKKGFFKRSKNENSGDEDNLEVGSISGLILMVANTIKTKTTEVAASNNKKWGDFIHWADNKIGTEI